MTVVTLRTKHAHTTVIVHFIAGYSIRGLAVGVTAPATHGETEPDPDGSGVSTRAHTPEADSSSRAAALGTSLPIT